MRILYIDEEACLDMALRHSLCQEGHDIKWAESGEKGIGIGTSETTDLIVLDIDLPDISGFQVIRDIRSNGVTAPILVTSTYILEYAIDSLDYGADYYESKPVSIDVLKARIRSIERRCAKNPSVRMLQTYDLCIDTESKIVTVSSERVNLTCFEYVLLETLAKNKGRFVRREELFELVYGSGRDTSSNILNVMVSRIRMKLAHTCSRAGTSAIYIHTLHSRGYMLEGQPKAVAHA